MTDPSPDCGYTAHVETVREALMAHQPPACDPPCTHGACAPHFALDALADALAEQIQRTDQAWEEIARLREFGEHYSGAAQDAWDRIAVLEKFLRRIADEGFLRHSVETQGVTYGVQVSFEIAYSRVVACAREALAAGSATPGGDET